MEPDATSSQAPLLDETQAADLMSVSPRTLQSWRLRGRGPAFVQVGSRIRYCPRTLAAWIRAQHATVPAPRKAKPVTLAHRPVLPPRMVDLMASEIARGFAGEVRMGATAYRRLSQAIGPHEKRLAQALCKETVVHADGSIHLKVQRNIAFTDAHLPRNQLTVAVKYAPRSGQWLSEVAAGQAGFDHLCGHVWRLQGRRHGMAARDLFAFIGAAYLALLSERGTA